MVGRKKQNTHHPHHPQAAPRSPTDTVCTAGRVLCLATHIHTIPTISIFALCHTVEDEEKEWEKREGREDEKRGAAERGG